MNEDAIRQLTQALNANTEARRNPQGAGPRLGVRTSGGTSAFFGGIPGVKLVQDAIEKSINLGFRQGFAEAIRERSLSTQLENIEDQTRSISARTTRLVGAGKVDVFPPEFRSQYEEIQTEANDNIESLNNQISEFESQISRLNAEMRELNETAFVPEILDSLSSEISNLEDQIIEGYYAIDEVNNNRKQKEEDLVGQITESIKGRMKLIARIKFAGIALGAFAATTTLIVKSLLKFRRSLIQTSQDLGGVSLSKAFEEKIGAFITSIRSLGTIGPQEIIQAKGAAAQEFGGLLTGASAEELVRFSQSTGVAVEQLIGLERALQGTGLEGRDALDQFKEAGIVGQVAAKEIQQNAAAVARAGDKFNSFIVEGIRNAKRLGLEFGKIEQTLTGFATNFEGTIDQFAGLRAVIPGFETDFNQLFSTALYGSTDDFVEQIRTGLQGAGITSVEGMSRTALAQLEQSTGFTADQIERILNNQDVNFDMQEDLDTTRNSLLSTLIKVTSTGLGALIGFAAQQNAGRLGKAALQGIKGAMAGGAAGTVVPGLGNIGGAIIGGISGFVGAGGIGALVGGGAGYAGGSLLTERVIEGNDIVSNPGYGERTLVTPTGNIALNNQDQLIAGTNLYGKGELSGPSQSSVNMQGVEAKLDRLLVATENQTRALQRGLRTEITGIDKGLTQLKDAEDRGLVYG